MGTACSICFDPMDFNVQRRLLGMECGHIFHGLCLEPWWRRNQSCPYCRMDCARPTSCNYENQENSFNCCVCAGEFAKDGGAQKLCVMDCGHIFHVHCLPETPRGFGPWKNGYAFKICPTCNAQSTRCTFLFTQ